MFDFLFKKKKPDNQGDVVSEKGTSQKQSIEERVEKELDALPVFIKNKIVKDPTIKEKFIKIAKQMSADGVDMNSPKAMKKWVKEHEKALKEQEVGKVETVVKKPEPGRNDLCPCGSGKKYKKCCGQFK